MRKKYNTPHRRHVVKTRMTDEEYADFTGRLAAYEISQSEFIRQAIRKATIRPIVTVSPVNDGLLAALSKLTAEYGKIGGNLNQIARSLNEYGSPYRGLEKEVRGAAADLAALKFEVLQKVGEAVGDITVTTKAGNYFYILIDRANEDKETAVHFLNQVDDADLQALLEDGKKEPEVCNCTAKCQAGAINTACPVCKNNLTACNGPEPKPQPEEEKPQEEKPSGMGGLVVFFVVVLLGGGAALYFLKFKKEKADTTGNDDLAEYDFGEDEDDEDEAPEPDEDMTSEDGNKEDEV